jgi:hypothetical protein
MSAVFRVRPVSLGVNLVACTGLLLFAANDAVFKAFGVQ